ncbi:MAG TPA: ABC-2 family transporter protein [Levilinea sp.]|nr:ABC-2 family transporter protein [Levilinea sp.]
MLNIFRRMWQVNWAEQWQYRANLIMYLLYGLISPVVFLSVWRSVAAGQSDVSGLTVNDFTIYYLTLLIVSKLTSEISIHILAYKIHDGTLSGELLRPVHPVLTSTLVSNLAYKALTFLALAPIWLALFFLFKPDFSSVTLSNLLLAAPVIVLGFGVNFLLGAIITAVAFWTTRVYALSEFTFGFQLLLGGIFVPLDLLPGAALRIAQVMPFQLFLYFPVQLILGRLSPEQVLANIALLLFWLAVTAVGFRFIWQAGIKHFSAVGA